MRISCNHNETISFDALAAELSIRLPAVADPIAKVALLRGAMKLLNKAKLMTYYGKQDFFNGVKDYEINVPECVTVLEVETVTLDDVEVEFSLYDSNWIKLIGDYCNYGDSPRGLQFEAYVGMSKDACEIPSTVYEKYGDVIINFALSTLYSMHGEDWYDVGYSKFYAGIAMGGVTDAKQDRLNQDIPDGIQLYNKGLLV